MSDTRKFSFENRAKDNASPKKIQRHPERILLHLDLKGAPPKPGYLRSLYPILAKWGITGVILEWEDCFPYTGDLQFLSNQVYAEEDALQIIKDIQEAKLQVIPLIQTFGHLEFVLKHNSSIRYREVPLYPSSLCPSHPDSLALISTLLNQVIPFHGNISHFHIGADEIWHMGLCERCKTRLQAGESKEDLFLKHVKGVLEMVHLKWPDLKLIMWDDMLRNMDESVIVAYNLAALVEPMVWHYSAAESFSLPPDIWRKYACFPGLWAAGAFKGATGGSQLVPPIPHHASNVLHWLRCIQLFKKPCRGFVLTGWSRYDHFAALCETLPSSVLSLGVCLRVLKEEPFCPETVLAIEAELRPPDVAPIKKPVEIEAQLMSSSWQIFLLTSRLMGFRQSTLAMLSCEQLQTWMNTWQVANNRVNPMQVIPLAPVLNNVVAEFNSLEKELREHMQRIFFPLTVDEWISTNIIALRSRAQAVLQTVDEVISKATKTVEEAVKLVEMDY